MLLKTLQAVIADIFADDGAVFLFDETVVIFMVMASGEGDATIFIPGLGVVIDKLRAVIAVELQDGQRDGCFDIRESLESPFLGVIKEGAQLNPAGSNVGGGQGMEIVA